MRRKIYINFDYNEEIKKCKTIDDVLGKNGLIQKLVKDVLENIFDGELINILEYININVKEKLILSQEIIEMVIVRSNGKIVNKSVYIYLGDTCKDIKIFLEYVLYR